MDLLQPRDVIYLGTLLVLACGFFFGMKSDNKTQRERFDKFELRFDKFIDQIQLTLFGADGRNGMVSDVRSAKEHTDECKKNSWHIPHLTKHAMSHDEELAACKLESAAGKALDRISAAADKAADKLTRVASEKAGAHE